MLEIKVCIGTSCHLRGSYNVMVCFQQLIEQYGLHDKINLAGQFCPGNCQDGVCVDIGGAVYSVTPETARAFFKNTILPAANAV